MLRWALAAIYGVAGVAHFTATNRFLLIVPDWVPEPRLVIQLTGACEMVGAIALLTPKLQRAAGFMLALYALCVFPANIKHAAEGISVPGLPDSWWYHGPRLALQPGIIWLTLYAARLIDWPLRSRSRPPEGCPLEPL
jgi:uncharacterized membrane protein